MSIFLHFLIEKKNLQRTLSVKTQSVKILVGKNFRRYKFRHLDSQISSLFTDKIFSILIFSIFLIQAFKILFRILNIFYSLYRGDSDVHMYIYINESYALVWVWGSKFSTVFLCIWPEVPDRPKIELICNKVLA